MELVEGETAPVVTDRCLGPRTLAAAASRRHVTCAGTLDLRFGVTCAVCTAECPDSIPPNALDAEHLHPRSHVPDCAPRPPPHALLTWPCFLVLAWANASANQSPRAHLPAHHPTHPTQTPLSPSLSPAAVAACTSAPGWCLHLCLHLPPARLRLLTADVGGLLLLPPPPPPSLLHPPSTRTQLITTIRSALHHACTQSRSHGSAAHHRLDPRARQYPGLPGGPCP